MSNNAAAIGIAKRSTIARSSDWKLKRLGSLYGRIALGSAFLSAVGSRFGLWDRTIDLQHFTRFLDYSAQVLSFVPHSWVPVLTWAATICETSLGILLIAGLWPRWVALASAILLAMFGTAMALSFGLQSPMDYSVYSASSAALLLALDAFGKERKIAKGESQC